MAYAENVQALIDASVGKTSDEILAELEAAPNAEQLGDLPTVAAMLARAAEDPDYAAQVCTAGQPEPLPVY